MLLPSGEDAAVLSRSRSKNRAQSAWGRLVDRHGERSAFRHLSAHVGGSDNAHRVLGRHKISTDIF